MLADLLTRSAAVFLPDEARPTHRMTLDLLWGDRPHLCVIGQNSSLAAPDRFDPTVTRCVRRARMLGLDGLKMRNLYGFITPYPDRLFEAADPLGPGADEAILEGCRGAGMTIVAWGGDRRQAARVAHVLGLLTGAGVPLHCLGYTQDGSPRHPLRLGYAVRPEPFVGRQPTAAPGAIPLSAGDGAVPTRKGQAAPKAAGGRHG